jgi:hypothetical protein
VRTAASIVQSAVNTCKTGWEILQKAAGEMARPLRHPGNGTKAGRNGNTGKD